MKAYPQAGKLSSVLCLGIGENPLLSPLLNSRGNLDSASVWIVDPVFMIYLQFKLLLFGFNARSYEWLYLHLIVDSAGSDFYRVLWWLRYYPISQGFARFYRILRGNEKTD